MQILSIGIATIQLISFLDPLCRTKLQQTQLIPQCNAKGIEDGNREQKVMIFLSFKLFTYCAGNWDPELRS